MSDAAKDEWVTRVLGVQFKRTEGGTAALKDAATAWREANEAVDAQISKLQSALRADEDEEMREIAEFGLNGLTAGFKVQLMAALSGAEAGNQGDLAKLASAAGRFRQFLEDDERIEACEENPFGVPVEIRSRLVPALMRLTEVAG